VTLDTYDGAGRITDETDPMGRVTVNQYNYFGELTFSGMSIPGTPGYYTSTNYHYDGAGNLLQSVDGNSHTIDYTYTARNQLKTMTTHPDYGVDNTTQYTYDLAGNLKTLTDPDHNQTIWDYDNLNRVHSVTDPLSHNTVYGYDADSNL